VAQRQLLGHHPAHRDAHHVGGPPPERIEQRGGIVGQLGDREGIGLRRRLAHAAVVVGHDVEVVAQAGEEGVAPREMRAAHALDEQQPLAGAAALVEQRDPVDGGLWHGAARYPMADSTPTAPACTRPAAPDRHPPKRAVLPARLHFAVRRPASTVRRHLAARDPEPVI
jgi:hypothetical protein